MAFSFRLEHEDGTPADPATQVSISKDGRVRYGVALIEPGSPPIQATTRQTESLVQDLYWLEVPSDVHQCRHEDPSRCM